MKSKVVFVLDIQLWITFFVVYAIVQRYLAKKSGKVYVCFVDFKKAFDTINTSILWAVLRRAAVGGTILKKNQSMYSIVQSCVRCPKGLTDFFDFDNWRETAGCFSSNFVLGFHK